MVSFGDMRDWIEKVRGIGELKVIEGADPNLEVGTMVQINGQNLGPALLFDSINGYKKGYRVLTNSLSNIRTFNLTFGLPINNTISETVETLRKKASQWAISAKNFSHKVVGSGPILENVAEGDDVNLEKFPVPLWHELDGGRYIGTGVGVITKDPDTGVLNIGTYRGQLHDSKHVGFYITGGKHGRMHRDKYFADKKSCPVVMIFGFDPLSYVLSASEIPHNVFEFDYMGAIREEPVSVIKGKYTGLPIPANAEIAIEGIANFDELKMEGPFGEWPGTYGSKKSMQPYIKALALYHRNDPILLGSPPSKGLASDQGFWRAIWRSALVYNEIERAGIPAVRGVWCPAFGGSRLFIIVSIKQSYPGHATEVGHIASQTRAGAYLGRYVVVVDDDIDPYDIEDVMWAICTRSDPQEMDIIKRAWSGPLDPLIREPTNGWTNSRGIIYAVKPYAWYDEFPKTSLNSNDLRNKVFAKWSSHFGDRWKVF